MIVRLATAAALIALTGCTGRGPIVGGPCTYETSEFDATVMGMADDGVTLAGPGGDTFEIPAAEFATPPEVGAIIRVQKDSITSGTCTPYMFRPTRT